jgi:hypothetical protein
VYERVRLVRGQPALGSMTTLGTPRY